MELDWNKASNWLKEVIKEMFKPKNFANGFVVGVIVLMVGGILGWAIPNYLTPKPNLAIECVPEGNSKFIIVKNLGNQSAEDVFAHFYFRDYCTKIGFSVMQSWSWHSPLDQNNFFGFYPIPKWGEYYKYETLIKTDFISPRFEGVFHLECPERIKVQAWAKNNALVEVEC